MLTDLTMPKLSRLFRLQWEEAQQAYVLLYPEGLVRLNPSAAEILKRCDGSREVADLVRELETAFQASDLGPDVLAFLAEARQRGWLV
ncbi:pyrroloquinoline quinone biosynthesis peptide chaperone PqqD [Rugamonas apoptosis]|uniref:Pyrroloquinoline quinone biosynthesis peptide chaperone PqqD n=1 Tax=Rugamonas apoptosis TaxID=2758570 RepID=A0A7W2FBD7_9BURK|nr:pyrroloquinoline quinone biosynthesis peptide chaperone PqqD [Rugamonas apoptosis]MBA5688520.1 pyrroloquinoline quinone biosynthesis peptide chaperone PqqD [Rugamonas apoptosis]